MMAEGMMLSFIFVALAALSPTQAFGQCVATHANRPALNESSFAVERFSGGAEFYLYRGVDHAFSGNDEAALEDYEAALRINPNYGLVYKQRAYIHLRRNEFAKAEADLHLALCFHPEYSEIQHSLGDVFYYAGKTVLAYSQWEETCDLAPGYDVRDWKERLAEINRFEGPLDGKCTKQLMDAFAKCAQDRCQF